MLGEISSHARWLLENAPAPEQRERLQYILQAARTLESLGRGTDTGAAKPAAEPPPRANGNEARQGGENRRRRVLLAEDNPFTQKLMVRLLTLQGFEVALAQNGQEALELLARAPFDLCLMDLRMPVLDGFQTAITIRGQEENGRGPRLPIIAVTALSGEEDRQRAMESGMDGYHLKPVRATALFAEMERLLQPRPSVSPPTAAVEPAAETLPVADMERLLKTVDGDRDLLKEIAELYFSDAPRQMARIQHAIASGLCDELREAAHSLKGATGAFGRVEVYHLAFAMEQAGRNGDLRQAEGLWNRLSNALKIMEETIKKEIIHLFGEN